MNDGRLQRSTIALNKVALKSSEALFDNLATR